MWVLGVKPESSGKGARALNYLATSPATYNLLVIQVLWCMKYKYIDVYISAWRIHTHSILFTAHTISTLKQPLAKLSGEALMM